MRALMQSPTTRSATLSFSNRDSNTCGSKSDGGASSNSINRMAPLMSPSSASPLRSNQRSPARPCLRCSPPSSSRSRRQLRLLLLPLLMAALTASRAVAAWQQRLPRPRHRQLQQQHRDAASAVPAVAASFGRTCAPHPPRCSSRTVAWANANTNRNAPPLAGQGDGTGGDGTKEEEEEIFEVNRSPTSALPPWEQKALLSVSASSDRDGGASADRDRPQTAAEGGRGMDDLRPPPVNLARDSILFSADPSTWVRNNPASDLWVKCRTTLPPVLTGAWPWKDVSALDGDPLGALYNVAFVRAPALAAGCALLYRHVMQLQLQLQGSSSDIALPSSSMVDTALGGDPTEVIPLLVVVLFLVVLL